MAVRQKATPSIDKFIEKGADVKESKENGFKNVLIRIPKNMLYELDEMIQKKPWTTRTQWIIEAIHEKLKNDLYCKKD